ncbi:MAG: hypothetical protein AAF851_05810 [Myxococcota bacterium]
MKTRHYTNAELNLMPDSRLLRLAVKDAKLCEADPNYIMRMNKWHTWHDHLKRCAVCLAGSVMAKSLDTPLQHTVFSCSEEHGWAYRLDGLRTGDFGHAVAAASVEQRKAMGRVYRHISDYLDPNKMRAPWAVYLEAADMLEAVGL